MLQFLFFVGVLCRFMLFYAELLYLRIFNIENSLFGASGGVLVRTLRLKRE